MRAPSRAREVAVAVAVAVRGRPQVPPGRWYSCRPRAAQAARAPAIYWDPIPAPRKISLSPALVGAAGRSAGAAWRCLRHRFRRPPRPASAFMAAPPEAPTRPHAAHTCARRRPRGSATLVSAHA